MKYLQFNGAVTGEIFREQLFSRYKLYKHLKSECLDQVNIQTKQKVYLTIFKLNNDSLNKIHSTLWGSFP